MKILASSDFFFSPRGGHVTWFWSVRCGKNFPGGASGKGFQKEQTACMAPLARILTNHCLCEMKTSEPGGFSSDCGERLLKSRALERERGRAGERGRERGMTASVTPLDGTMPVPQNFPIWGANKSLSSLSRFTLGFVSFSERAPKEILHKRGEE